MDKKEIFDRIEYVVACVGAFAQRYQLSNMQAYAYLRRFTGIAMLPNIPSPLTMRFQTYKLFANEKELRYDKIWCYD